MNEWSNLIVFGCNTDKYFHYYILKKKLTSQKNPDLDKCSANPKPSLPSEFICGTSKTKVRGIYNKIAHMTILVHKK